MTEEAAPRRKYWPPGQAHAVSAHGREFVADEEGQIDLTDEPRHVIETLVTIAGCKPVRDDHPPIPPLVSVDGPMKTFTAGKDHGPGPDGTAVVVTTEAGSTTIVDELPPAGEPNQVVVLAADQQAYRFDPEAGWVPHTPPPEAVEEPPAQGPIDPPPDAAPTRLAPGGVKPAKRVKAT